MFERNSGGVSAFVAFGAVLAIIAGYWIWTESAKLTEQRIRDEQRAEYHIEYAEDRIDHKCLSISDQTALRNCIHEEIEAARDHSRAEGDLEAQQIMARFTRIMGFTGIAGIALAGVSVALILATLWETRAGVEVMRGEQRPWVIGAGIDLSFRDNSNINGILSENVLSFAVNWANSGQSPAVLHRSVITWWLIPFGDPIETISPNYVPAKSILGPGLTASSARMAIGGNHLKALLARKAHLILYGRVDYGDTVNSGPKYFTEVTFRLERNGTVMSDKGDEIQPNITNIVDGPQNSAT